MSLFPSFLTGGVLQHRESHRGPVLPDTLLPAASGQQDAVHRIIGLHPELSRLRVQQRRSAQIQHNRRHGELQLLEAVIFKTDYYKDNFKFFDKNADTFKFELKAWFP